MGHYSNLIAIVFCGVHKKPSQPFDEWAAIATQDQVLELFLEHMRKGEVGLRGALTDQKVTYFDAIFVSVTGKSAHSPNTEIAVPQVLSHLAEVHRERAALITAAREPLTTLLLSHASFPFSVSAEPVLTRSSLLRAIAILTKNSDNMFRQGCWIDGKLAVRERTPSSRINYIFVSLASALPVAGSVDDVLDVLCRANYPRVWDRKAQDFNQQLITRLEPVAERLCQQTEAGKSPPQYIAVTELQPLADLVAALTGEQASSNAALQGKEQLDSQEFEAWATEVQLMSGLDKLFACFLRDKDSIYQCP